jgi:hypothetical protein
MNSRKAGDVERDAQPGISAVLAAAEVSTDLEGDVLDLAAVLDGLVNDQFEIIVAEVAAAHPRTAALAELRARHPDLPLRVLEGDHADQAQAWVAGFEAAAYDLIFVTTADGQFEVCESNHLLDAIEGGADLAIGYRARRADSLARRVQGGGWNMLVRLMFGQTGRDVDCPVRLFRRTVWQHLAMRPRRATPIFNAEFLVRARRLKFQVVEVPLSHRNSRSAEVRAAASPVEIGRAFVQLLELRRELALRQAPSDGAAGRRVPSGRQIA